MADRRAWIGVLGSAFFSPCLDRSSSRRAWIGDRESGLALVTDRRSSGRAWIGVLLGVVLPAWIESSESLE